MHDYLDHYVTTDSPNFTLASCQLQNLTRQRCLCQIWAVWRSSEHASSSPNKCQLALSNIIRVFRGVKKSASDSFSISEVVLRFAEYFLWIIDLDFTFLEEFWGLHICSHHSITGITAAQPAKWLKMFLPMSPRPAMVKAMTHSGVSASPSRAINGFKIKSPRQKMVLSNLMLSSSMF